MIESNYIARNERDKKIVQMCDDGETYASVGRQFGIGGDSISQIYFKACRKRNRLKGNAPEINFKDRVSLLATRRVRVKMGRAVI